jgi:DNA-binding transcriptional LysR family regulator
MESMFFGDLVHGILAAELDLAIITEPPPNPMLTIVPLITAPLYVVLSVDHKASRKTAGNPLRRARSGLSLLARFVFLFFAT